MTDETKADGIKPPVEGGVFGDVQKGLAWFIVIAFVVLIFVWVFKPPVMAPESMAQLNQLVSTLQNILLLAVGFFFGSSKLAQNKDEAQNKAAEKLADKLPTPPNGSSPAIVAAAEAAAPAAAAEAAPPAAAVAAPPAVDAELDRRGVPDPDKPKE